MLSRVANKGKKINVEIYNIYFEVKLIARQSNCQESILLHCLGNQTDTKNRGNKEKPLILVWVIGDEMAI